MGDAERLEVASRAARDAGRLALTYVGNPLYFKLKSRRDLLVGAALEVQASIRETLIAAIPEDAFLGEEGPEDEPLPVDAERLWIVDPIDGSTNFFRGIPVFAISIAFRDANGMRLGVVYDPNRDELFSAITSSTASASPRTSPAKARMPTTPASLALTSQAIPTAASTGFARPCTSATACKAW
jgi:myo-inositol-1(or 4)-monophosphatase